MTVNDGNPRPADARLPHEACARDGNSILANWKLLLALTAVALSVGAGLNWSWLAAAGIAPIILTLAPCVVMCALHLCMKKITNERG